MLVVGAPEAAERLLGLARITVAQDDQAAVRDLLGQRAVALDDGIVTVSSSVLSASSTCSALLAGMASLRPQLLLDQRRELRRPMLGRPRDVEPLRQLHLRHEQKHHDRGQTLAAAPGAIGRAPEASQLSGLAG